MTHDNNTGDGPNQLDAAVHKLERDGDRLARLRAEEAEIEREVKGDIKKIEEIEAERNKVEIHVVHVNEVEKASFKEKSSATLQQVWDKSYEKLEIARQPKDVFQTGGEHPKSLMSHLGLTLEQGKELNVIENYHFGIASETGGA